MSKFLEAPTVTAMGGFAVTTLLTWALAGAALAAGPAVTTAPQIQGTAQEGKVLTFAPGVWSDLTTVAVTDGNWQLCNPTCADTGVSSATPYTVPAGAATGTIHVVETASATDGVSTATASTAPVLPPPPASGTLSISGTPQIGQNLTAITAGWSPAPTAYSFAWTSGGAPVGTNSATYTVAPTDVGRVITVRVVASDAGGSSVPVTAATAAVLPLAPVNTVPPAISGTPQQGQVLTVTPGVWTSNLIYPTSITEQWESCTAQGCKAIPGETGSTYTVGPNDVGQTIEVVETAAPLGVVATLIPLAVVATSARTATVSATSATSVVAYSQSTPTTNQGVTLVATVVSNSPNAGPHGSLSFFNGSDVIRGCGGKGVSGRQTITIVCQASFPAGVAQISATYVADPASLVAGSSSDTTPVSVGKGPTSLSLAVTPQVAPGGRAMYVATLGVPVSNAGPTLPSGSIEFLDGGQPIGGCASQPVSNLTATCSVSYPTAGTHSVSAVYNGDSNFTGSSSPASTVQIVKGAAKAPTVHGGLGSTLGWKIAYHPRYSELIALEAYAVPKGTTILVQCFGKSCPFAKWRLTKAGTVNLLSRFRRRHLRAGTRITVRLTRRHWVGKYYSFTIRAGHAPVVRTDCLAPGAAKPGLRCASPAT